MKNPYEDMINLPRHTSASHPHMSLHDRAAQFSPFAALTGYSAAITEAARLTDRKVELDEYHKAELDEKLQIIHDQIDERPKVTITYFQEDRRKAGGTYVTKTGNLKKIDGRRRMVVMTDEMEILIDDIFEIDGIEM